MLRRVRRSPVAREKDGEDHRGEKCVGESEATPYPERKQGAGGGNYRLREIQPREIRSAEKNRLHPRAEKTHRADSERFLDSVTIEAGLGNGAFGGRVADHSEDKEENAGGLLRGMREKNNEEEPGRSPHNDQGEEEQDQPQVNVGGTEVRNRFLFQKLVLRLGQEAF